MSPARARTSEWGNRAFHTTVLIKNRINFLSVSFKEKQHLISEQNAKIAELRQEVKQLKESRNEETATSEAVLELQAHLNDANEEVTELKQMLEEAGEAFTEKEAEISKLRATLDDQEACMNKQVGFTITG